jgi:hypothetical protein
MDHTLPDYDTGLDWGWNEFGKSRVARMRANNVKPTFAASFRDFLVS